jgi:hypothetical protein
MTVYDDRLELAHEITDVLLQRYGDHIRAIGLHGSMAHADVDERSDLDFHIVVADMEAIPVRSMWVDGVYVSLSVKTEEILLASAREVDELWAAGADRFVVKLALYDPDGVFDRVRRAHVEASSEASSDDAAFVEVARGLVFDAHEALSKASRYSDQGVRAATNVCLHESLVAMALSVGLLTRTRWRGTHLAVAAASHVGREIEGFAASFDAASDDDRTFPERSQAAGGAARALRSHLERRGVVFEVRSASDLVG